MKTKLIAFLLFISLFSFGQDPSGCNSSNWPSSVPAGGTTGVAFSVPAGSGTGWTYKWVVTSSLQIVGSATGTTAYIRGNASFNSGTVYVTRYKDGVSACADMKFVTITPNCNPCITCNYNFGISDKYTSGPESNINMVELSIAGSNTFPAGTTYSFAITRQDGNVQYYDPIVLPTKRRWVETSFGNRITNATVIASYLSCTKTVSVDFKCAIPNNDIDGVCFPECDCPENDDVVLTKISTTIKVSPNPTSSVIKFEGKDLNNYKVSIFNYNGTEIITNSKIDQEINLAKQQKGIYFYIITDDKGFKQEGKIIKE